MVFPSSIRSLGSLHSISLSPFLCLSSFYLYGCPFLPVLNDMDFIPVLSAEPCEVRRQQPNGTSKTKRLITAKRNRKVRTWKQLKEEDSKCMRKTVIVRLLVHCSLASSVRPPFTTFPRSTRSQPSSLTSVRSLWSLPLPFTSPRRGRLRR